MKRAERELDEFGKKLFAPLHQVPPLDSRMMEQEKAHFLLEAENLRQNMIPGMAGVKSHKMGHQPARLQGLFSLPVYKALVIGVLVLILLTASSFTVFAAQSSLPGQALYPVKSASEDVALTLAFSPSTRLNLTLQFTNRRMNEIQALVAEGKPVPDQTTDLYQQELNSALQLATQMNNQQMQTALSEIKTRAQDQGLSVGQIITHQPHQATPAMVHLQERLQEQVQLSTMGEANPQEFRSQMQQREHLRHGEKQSSATEEIEATSAAVPILATATPAGGEENAGGANPIAQPTEMPGNKSNGNKPGQSTSGNGNHGPNPTDTLQP
jgi:acyl CoA:acetate/3-ketoacid CoA transferase alpha subunit